MSAPDGIFTFCTQMEFVKNANMGIDKAMGCQKVIGQSWMFSQQYSSIWIILNFLSIKQKHWAWQQSYVNWQMILFWFIAPTPSKAWWESVMMKQGSRS